MPPYDEVTCGGAQALLEPYLDGELEAPEAERLRAHLARCPPCAAELRLAAGIRRALRALPELEAPPEILARTLESIRSASRFQPPAQPPPSERPARAWGRQEPPARRQERAWSERQRPWPPRRAALAAATGIAALLAASLLLLHPLGTERAGTEGTRTGSGAPRPGTTRLQSDLNRPSAAAVALAAREARYALAYVGRASRRAGLTLRDEVIERRVVLPATWSAARPLHPTPGFEADSTSPPRKGT
jgi:anti-sigma factor (TIGR02949 family)